jgi:hypothetical protein
MLKHILRDSEAYPGLFLWNGPLDPEALDRWEQEQAIRIPQDFRSLWTTKGGGDMFGSETILQPFGVPEYDLVLPVSQVWWERGLARDYAVFHKGLGLSVFRTSDGALFSCVPLHPEILSPIQDLDTWYVTNLRPQFGGWPIFGVVSRLDFQGGGWRRLNLWS